MSQRDIFIAALQQDDAAERRRYLDEACGTDAALREEIEGLLRVHEKAGSFLEPPPQTPAATLDAPVRERPGTVIGPYKLLQQIGEGGMGTVFMAEQTEPIQRQVALKIIKAGMDTRQVIARFEAERQALALMDHVNIARVLDAGATESGRPYFVMELVHGVPITQYCDDNHLTPRERLELFVPVCQAIQHAHQKGIIHRDVKPSNVMITLYDGKPVPKVIDFGVAKATEQKLTERTLFTQYGTMVGTLEYMSPEQAEMSALGVDTRSDIYSLGVLLYELLTGNTPLSHKTMKEAAYAEILRMIKEEEPPRPSTRLSDSGEALASISANRHMEPAKLTRLVRGELDWVVMKCLEKDRNRRYETANGFARDLQRYLADEPVLACPPSAGYRLRKFARRNKRALATVATVAVAILLAAGAVGWAVRDREAREEELVRDRAARQAVTAQQATESLTRARRLISENKLALARHELAEAKGRIGDDRAALPGVTQAFDELEAELAARTNAQDRFRDFFAWIDQALEREIPQETALAGESIPPADRNPREAVPLILRALALYGVLEQDDWSARLEQGLLQPAQVTQIRRSVYEKLLWLADDVLTRKEEHATGRKLSGPAAARQALAYLKQAEALPPCTRAWYWVRSRSWQQLPDSAAAKTDEQRAKEAPTLMAVDHSLPGLVAYRKKNKAEAVREFEAALRVDPSHYWSLMWLGWSLCDLGEGRERAEAVRVFTGCLLLRPRHAYAYYCRANAYQRLHRLNEALADYSKAIELKPDLAQAWYNRGLVYAELKQYDKALADYSTDIDLRPDRAEAWYNRGSVYSELRQYDKAVADYSTVIKLRPDRAEPWNSRGIANRALRQNDKALVDYSKAIELKPALAEAWYGRGLAYATLQKYDKAIADNSKAIELKPDYAEAWNNRGNANHALRQYDKALADCSRAIELKPDWAEAWNNRGGANRALRQYDKALADFSKAIELKPDLAKAWYNRGNANHALRQYDKALADFSKAIDLRPDYAEAWNNRGLAYATLQQYDKALADYAKAMELKPALPEVWYGRGLAHAALQQYDKAIADYRKVLELMPKHAGVCNNLAWLLANCPGLQFRDPKQATELSKKAVDLDPKNAGYRKTLGVAQYRAGDFKAAAEALNKSMEMRKGGDSFDWFFLAMAHWQLDKKVEARKRYDAAVQWMDQHAPQHEELRRFRAEAAALLRIEDKSNPK